VAQPARDQDGVPERVYVILARIGLRHIDRELAAGRGDRQELLADRAVLVRAFGSELGDEPPVAIGRDQQP
jgi:hypothetical protein